MEHTPRMFLNCAIWYVLEYIFRELSIKKLYEYLCNINIGARMGGRLGPRPSPLGKKYFIIWWPFCYLFSILGPFCNVFLLMAGGLFTHMGAFFSMWRAIFVLMGSIFALAPPPYENF